MKKSAKDTQFYDFGRFRLDVSNRLLLSEGEHIPITQKCFEILCFLIRNRNRMLRKQEILDEVWSESYVEEANLAQHIYMLRKALKNNGCADDLIETIPKYGYRFNAEVDEVRGDEAVVPSQKDGLRPAPEGAEAAVSSAPAVAVFEAGRTAGSHPAIRPRRYLVAGTAAIAGLLAVIISAAAYLYWAETSADVGLKDIRSISVVPFEQIGGEQDEKLGLGLADTLISRLGNQSVVSISPTSTISKFADGTRTPIEIGRELGVDAILTGTIQKEGDRVRINVQLISVKRRTPVWADRIDTDLAGVFRLQDVISAEVARKLTSTLTGEPLGTETALAAGTPGAVREFTEGIYFWNKRTGSDLEKAIRHFGEAVRQDPSFATAQAMLADSYALAAIYGVKSIRPQDAIALSKQHSQKALEIDESTSEAYSAQAVVAQYEKDAPRALSLLEKAIEYDANNAAARMRLAWIYAVDEDLEAAIREMKLAQKADPHSQVINLNLARLLRLNRQTDEALEFGRRAVELDPSAMWTRVILAEIYEQKGMYEESIQELRSVPSDAPEQQTAKLLMSRVLAKKGNRNEARKMLKDVTNGENAETPAYEIASVYALLGEKQEAFRELKKAEEDSLIHYLHIKYDYNLDALRDNPEYPGILTQSRRNFIENYDRNS